MDRLPIDLPKSKNIQDDVDFIYNWAKASNISSRLIIINGRSFGSLSMALAMLLGNNTDPSQLFDIINQYNEFITIDDIAMAYYGILIQDNTENPLPLVNDFYRQIAPKLYDTIESLEDKYDSWLATKKDPELLAEIRQKLTTNISVQEIYDFIATNKPTITLNDFIMVYYELLVEQNVADPLPLVNEFYKNIDKFENQETLDNKYNSWLTVNNEKYDNDATLSYKWRQVFDVPIKFIIVRPRTVQDGLAINGTPKYIFESLSLLIQRLYFEGYTPAEIRDTIVKYNRLIRPHDIVMVYYILLDQLVNRVTAAHDQEVPLNVIINTNQFSRPSDISDIYAQLQKNNEADKLYIKVNQFAKDMNDITRSIYYEDENSIQRDYISWITGINKISRRNDKRFNTIVDIQQELDIIDKREHLEFSPLVINKVKKSFNPSIIVNEEFNRQIRPVTPEDGLDIFNRANVSRYIPFICYNDNYGRPVYKIFTEGKAENEPNYSIIIPKKMADHNTIYMTLWLGDPEDGGIISLHDAPRSSFFIVNYELTNNILAIESPVEDVFHNETLAHQRTEAALPNLVFGDGNEIGVSGEFNIWDVTIDETSLLDMILTDPLMNVYLYMEENTEPFAVKKRIDIHYRSIFTDITELVKPTERGSISNYSAVWITLTPKKAFSTDLKEIKDPVTGDVTTYQAEQDEPYLHINIKSGESRTVVDDFIKIFRLLMKYYIDTYDTPTIDVNIATQVTKGVITDLDGNPVNVDENGYVIINPSIKGFYDQFLPKLKGLEAMLPQKKQAAIKVKGKKHRKAGPWDQAPDLFVTNYNRNGCQHPPTIIDPDLIDEQDRQVMPFPKDNPEWYFICPYDDMPFPGVKINDKLPNKDIYPYIPCCYIRDQMAPNTNSKYNDYISGKAIEPVKAIKPTKTAKVTKPVELVIIKPSAKAEGKLVTDKILPPDAHAWLPRAVDNIVKDYSEHTVDMVRYGTIYTTNSLLHCVCTALDDPYYISLPVQAKEVHVANLRQYMSRNILPSLMKQEMYDYSDSEIMNLFRDNSKFFDPALFYRAVEETFSINIYVFTPPSRFEPGTELGSIEIPRHKIFHARPLRIYRPTVVIIKFGGTKSAESDVLPFPKCELIVDYDLTNRRIVKLFGERMTTICHDVLMKSSQTLTISKNLEVRDNIYYRLDHKEIFKVPIDSQFIDDNGKMRALTLRINGNLLTITTIPSQPENVLVNNNELARVSAEFAIGIFGDPTGITRNSNGFIDGLWFKIMDIVFGEYIPINPTDDEILDKLPEGPANPIVSENISVTQRLRKLKRTLNTIVQITRWLYELVRSNQNMTPQVFANQYIKVNDRKVVNSAEFYDLSNINRALPNVATIDEAIRIMRPNAPTLFSADGKIVMYNEEFKDRIVGMLNDYSNSWIVKQKDYIKFIDKFYETEEDFRHTGNSKIFTSRQDLDSWLKSLKTSQNYSKYFGVRTKIDVTMGTVYDPYIYQDTDNKIYIIQNVIGGSIEKAFTVSTTWRDLQYNIGSDPAQNDPVSPYLIYAISPASTIIPVQYVGKEQNDDIKLLYYGNQDDHANGVEGRYASMMEIL